MKVDSLPFPLGWTVSGAEVVHQLWPSAQKVDSHLRWITSCEDDDDRSCT